VSIGTLTGNKKKKTIFTTKVPAPAAPQPKAINEKANFTTKDAKSTKKESIFWGIRCRASSGLRVFPASFEK
jgi:hypothetical protein